MTERTYRKDLEVIKFVNEIKNILKINYINLQFLFDFQWLRDEMSKEDDEMGQIESVNMLLNLIDPIYDAHSAFLKDIEMRLNNWDPPCVADVLLQHFNNLEVKLFKGSVNYNTFVCKVVIINFFFLVI